MDEKEIEKLRENEERLRLGLEAGRVAGIWDWDIKSGKVHWTSGLEKMHHMEPGQFKGTIEAVQKEIHPDDREYVASRIQNALESKSDHYSSEYRIVCPDGSIRWVMGMGRVLFDEEQRPGRMVGLCLDITERMQAGEALRISTLKFRSVIEAANDAIIITDAEGMILLCNDATANLFGLQNELIGKPITVLMPERYRGVYGNAFSTKTEESRIIGKTTELHGLRKDGTEFPVELSLSTWMMGEKPYFSAAIRDITKRKRAETSLQKKTTLIQLLQEIAIACNEAGATDPVLQFALRAICEYTNWPVGHVYFHVPHAQYELRPSSIWHFSDPNLFEEFKRTTEATVLNRGQALPGRVLETGAHVWIADVTKEPTFQRTEPATEIGVVSGFAFPVTIGSDVVAVLEFFTAEVTPPDEALLELTRHIGALLGRLFERQRALHLVEQAELQYRTLVQSVQAIVWRADVETLQFRFVSAEAETILGYPVSLWLQEPDFWVNHIYPDDRDWAMSFCKKTAKEQRPYEFEYRMIASDGQIVWLRDFVRVITENGAAKDLIGVKIDITRQKNYEQQLNRSRERLRALSAHLQSVREEERMKIAREIHDELGQMLTALKMDLSLLNHGLMESSAVMPRPQLMKEIGSMCNLVDNTIHTVRRIAAELRPEVLDHLDLKAAIQWQANEFQGRSKIACRVRSKGTVEDLNIDQATALFRIFQETLTNVARHSKASRVNIRLDREDSDLTLEVSDNGRGVTETEILNTKSFGILGMRERALLLGGELHISGKSGKGTTVTVRVPLSGQSERGAKS